MGGLTLGHWLVVLVIVVLVFGTKRLGNVGKDLGEAVKGFKKGIRDEDDKPAAQLRDDSHDAGQQSSNTTNKQDDRMPR